jgi:hypothetical protein
MSRGFGYVERWLLGCIGFEPMAFKQILDIAYPVGSFENDMAKAIVGSNVGGVRSLRRALGKLCDLGVIQIAGRRPHHYRLHPFFKGCEHNPKRIALLCLILKGEPAMTPVGPNPLKIGVYADQKVADAHTEEAA